MAKYRKKPVVIEAVRWGGRGDHYAVELFPADGTIVPWVASQTDVLAEDWELLP